MKILQTAQRTKLSTFSVDFKIEESGKSLIGKMD